MVGLPTVMYYQVLYTVPYPTYDLTDQVLCVTGSNIGLGLECARHFVRLNAKKVILAVRDVKKGEAAKADIERTTKRTGVVDVYALDLGSYASTKAFAARLAELPRLDALVENAGVAMSKFVLAEEHESTITINVINTFLLALLALPTLRASAKKYDIIPRLTIVSSEVHWWTKIPDTKENVYDVISQKSKADMATRYPLSKLFEVYLVRELAYRTRNVEPRVTINILNPGLCQSGLSRNATGIRSLVLETMKLIVGRSSEAGSRTLVHAAQDGWDSHGMYESNGFADNTMVAPYVTDAKGNQVQAKVWKDTMAKLEAIQPGISKNIDA